MLLFRVPMKWLEKRIMTADAEEMDEMLKNVISWHERRFPDQELVIWSLPLKDRQERKRQIEMAAHLLNTRGEHTKR